MPSIRIRKPFAASFAVFLLASAYLGLSTQKIPSYGQSDKGLHFVTFLLLTTSFYWIVETARRRVVHLTLLICTAGLGIGSEVLQALLPNGRTFDPFDIVANVVGSALALMGCSWYHKRMLERRRKNKQYDIVPGDELNEEDEGLGGEERDVELGEGIGSSRLASQETGSVSVKVNGGVQAETDAPHKTDVTGELDDWDENAEDWDEEPTDKVLDGQKTPAMSVEEGEDATKKRTD